MHLLEQYQIINSKDKDAMFRLILLTLKLHKDNKDEDDWPKEIMSKEIMSKEIMSKETSNEESTPKFVLFFLESVNANNIIFHINF